jgi:hypothetical protein
MRSADDIRRLFKNAELRIHPDGDERVFEDVLQARRHPMEDQPVMPDSIWRTIMKSPLTKLAAAAVVVIACLIGLSLWRTTGSGIALADVLARIEQVKAFRYQLRFKIASQDPNKPYSFEIRAGCLESQDYGTKSNVEQLDPKGGPSTFIDSYVLPQKKTRIEIRPKEKKYSRTELDEAEVERRQKQHSRRDPRAILKGILECKYESLGRSTLKDIEVEGFQTTDPNFTTGVEKIWVDVKTRLPVRFEEDYVSGKMSEHMAMSDFQWDVPVAPAEFEPVIPDDYTRLAGYMPAKWPPRTEETAITGLKLYADLSGNYPKKLNTKFEWSDIEKIDTPAAKRLQEEIKGLSGDDKADRIMDVLLPFNGLGRFYAGLQYDKKDPAYYGKTVTPKDADKVLLRWKVSDNEYRVIFGDLHAQTVTAEKLAELEKALPK